MSIQSQSKIECDNVRIFYDILALLVTLRPASGRRRPPKSNWRRFIDSLSWLSDHKTGGQTTVSIAIEKTTEGSRFWMASNATEHSRTFYHLSNILSRLASLRNMSTGSIQEMQEQIARSSIQFCRRKVHDYTKRLRVLIEQICSEGGLGKCKTL